ncbi:MAG TPA: hypothetical protein DCP91_02300 [Eggerthellaceae bacterium]|nr:hypothetical protein [Eggerthellaceae bacterium]
MSYIKRDAEQEFLALCEEFPVVLVTGMRQAGKSTMLEHFLDGGRKSVTLDRGTGAIVCMKQEVGVLPGGTLYMPAWAL